MDSVRYLKISQQLWGSFLCIILAFKHSRSSDTAQKCYFKMPLTYSWPLYLSWLFLECLSLTVQCFGLWLILKYSWFCPKRAAMISAQPKKVLLFLKADVNQVESRLGVTQDWGVQEQLWKKKSSPIPIVHWEENLSERNVWKINHSFSIKKCIK